MGKRSDFDRNERDHYATPGSAMAPLLPFLRRGTTFCEPCAGEGGMVDYFESAGHPCVFACDVEPLRADVTRLAAAELRFIRADQFITNPPWLWEWLEPIAFNLSGQLSTWLLLAADLMHNIRSAKLMERCSTIVPIGRVKWIDGSKHSAVDNTCWYLFEPGHKTGPRIAPRARLSSR